MDPLTEWYSGTVHHEVPFAWRYYRHRETGELALLTIGLAHPPGGPFHAVIAARPNWSTIRGVHWGRFAKDLNQARER